MKKKKKEKAVLGEGWPRVITLGMNLLILIIQRAAMSFVGEGREPGRGVEDVDAEIHGFFACCVITYIYQHQQLQCCFSLGLFHKTKRHTWK